MALFLSSPWVRRNACYFKFKELGGPTLAIEESTFEKIFLIVELFRNSLKEGVEQF